jgi:hypothetical protein
MPERDHSPDAHRAAIFAENLRVRHSCAVVFPPRLLPSLGKSLMSRLVTTPQDQSLHRSTARLTRPQNVEANCA